MITVVLVVLAVAGVWAIAAVAVALLAGGVIHARDHEDAPYGGFARSRVTTPARAARFVPVRARR